jgi:rhomboid protease GluP
LRKRAPKLERRGGALEAQRPRRRRRLLPRRPSVGPVTLADRPYATLVAILGPAVLMIVQTATGGRIVGFGGILTPFMDDWWRYLTAPFVYGGVGYLFVVALALAIFSTGVERRLGTAPTAILLLATGALGALAATGVANAREEVTFVIGGNGMALGMLAAWFALRRAEARGAIDQEYDKIGVAVCAVVLLALPIFASAADPVACVAGGVVGGLAGLLAAVMRPAH